MEYRVLKGNLAIQTEGQTVCPKVGEVVIDPIGANGLVKRGGLEPIGKEPEAEKPKPKRGRRPKQPEAE